jgi:hypothetical protein
MAKAPLADGEKAEAVMDIEDRPDLNTGEPWSEMDLFDLANNVRLGNPVEEIAVFLCRSRREVREKIAELEQSGELARRVAETAANAESD